MQMKKFGLIISFLFLLSFYAERDTSAHAFNPITFSDTLTCVDTVFVSAKADSIVTFAKTLLGTPYKYGSCSPKAFDCSGFVYYVMKHNGIELPRSFYEMGTSGKEIALKDCRKGDLILFKGTNANSKRIGHVGLVISEHGQPLEFIHSSSNKKKWGVITSCFADSDYYPKRFVKVVRVL